MEGINPELLERYFKQQCTPEESLHVEKWLLLNRFENGLGLSATEKSVIHESIWNKFVSKVDQKPSTYVFKRKWVHAITTAACLVLTISVTGLYLLKPAPNIQDIAETTVPDMDNSLWVRTNSGETKKIISDHCNIEVEGILFLHNNSDSTKTVTSGDITLKLNPNQSLYLSNRADGHPMAIPSNHPLRDSFYTSKVPASFKICV